MRRNIDETNHSVPLYAVILQRATFLQLYSLANQVEVHLGHTHVSCAWKDHRPRVEKSQQWMIEDLLNFNSIIRSLLHEPLPHFPSPVLELHVSNRLVISLASNDMKGPRRHTYG